MSTFFNSSIVIAGLIGAGCITCSSLFLLFDDQPVRTLLFVHVEAFAIVTSDTFAYYDLRPANRSPLARLFANLAGITFGPTLDSKNSQVREQSEKSADRAEEQAIQMSDENRGDQQHGKTDPHPGRSLS